MAGITPSPPNGDMTWMFERVVEPATHAAKAAATELSHIGLELTLDHVGQHAEMRAEVAAAQSA